MISWRDQIVADWLRSRLEKYSHFKNVRVYAPDYLTTFALTVYAEIIIDGKLIKMVKEVTPEVVWYLKTDVSDILARDFAEKALDYLLEKEKENERPKATTEQPAA